MAVQNKYKFLMEVAGLSKEEIIRLSEAYDKGYQAGYKKRERESPQRR